MTASQPTAPEDDLEDLPPLDGEADERLDDSAVDEALEVPDGEGAEDEPEPGTPTADDVVGYGEHEASWVDEAADASDLNIGEIPLIEAGDPAGMGGSDADEAKDVGDDLDAPEPVGATPLDAGDEGPVGPDEELRDEDLPALDADEDGEPSEQGFFDARLTSEDALGIPWAARPWSPVGAPMDLGATSAVACAGRCALVAVSAAGPNGRTGQLAQIDLEGSRVPLPARGLPHGEIIALANDGTAEGTIAILLRGGEAAISNDGGRSFAPALGVVAATACAVASGRAWIRTESGEVLRSGPNGFEACVLPGRAAALAQEGATASVAAVLVDGARGVQRLGPDGATSWEPFADAGPLALSGLAMAARFRFLALGGRQGLWVRDPGGAFVELTGWHGRVTAVAFVDDAGTLVAAVYSEMEDTTALVRVAWGGRPAVVARVGAARDQGDSDARVSSLACDDARGVLWVAGGFGVAAFSMAGDLGPT